MNLPYADRSSAPLPAVPIRNGDVLAGKYQVDRIPGAENPIDLVFAGQHVPIPYRHSGKRCAGSIGVGKVHRDLVMSTPSPKGCPAERSSMSSIQTQRKV